MGEDDECTHDVAWAGVHNFPELWHCDGCGKEGTDAALTRDRARNSRAYTSALRAAPVGEVREEWGVRRKGCEIEPFTPQPRRRSRERARDRTVVHSGRDRGDRMSGVDRPKLVVIHDDGRGPAVGCESCGNHDRRMTSVGKVKHEGNGRTWQVIRFIAHRCRHCRTDFVHDESDGTFWELEYEDYGTKGSVAS